MGINDKFIGLRVAVQSALKYYFLVSNYVCIGTMHITLENSSFIYDNVRKLYDMHLLGVRGTPTLFLLHKKYTLCAGLASLCYAGKKKETTNTSNALGVEPLRTCRMYE